MFSIPAVLTLTRSSHSLHEQILDLGFVLEVMASREFSIHQQGGKASVGHPPTSEFILTEKQTPKHTPAVLFRGTLNT